MGALHRAILTTLIAAAVPSVAEADCTCRARGVVAEHGQTLCIRTPEGFKLARCDKVSNVASWTFLGEACPQVASRHGPMSVPAGLLISHH